MHEAFDRLCDPLREHLYGKGWRSLRPIQTEAILAYFDSTDHIVISAETAAGKTEAAFLPILSRISDEPHGSVRALYVGPLRALINDQFDRLTDLCATLRIPVHRWHGDVGSSHKSDMLDDPSGVLLITPESIESLLVNRARHLAALFGGLRAVVIDELHVFLASERGLHLASLLARLREIAESPPRLIGLSATVGDPAAAQRYLDLDAPSRVRLVSAASAGKELRIGLHTYPRPLALDDGASPALTAADPRSAQIGAAAADIVNHVAGHPALIFANARADIESLAERCSRIARSQHLPDAFLVHHASVSREEREAAEAAMKSRSPHTAICSSTLELGIDIGGVWLVGQVGPPWSVASLAQRLGRSGRKSSEPRRLRMYVLEDADPASEDPVDRLPLSLLQAVATIDLLVFGRWLEPPAPPTLDLSTLTQQVISLIAQRGSASAPDLHESLCRRGPFRAVGPPLLSALLRSLGSRDVLDQDPRGWLILGLAGERIRASRDFYAVFATPRDVEVRSAGGVIGTLPSASLPAVGSHLVLAGRRWVVTHAEHDAVLVVPSSGPARPVFQGSGADVHPRIRERMREVLHAPPGAPYLDTLGREVLSTASACAAESRLAERALLPLGRDRTLWLTWTGTRAQRTLLASIRHVGMTGHDREIAIEVEATPDDLWTALPSLLEPAPERLARHVTPRAWRKYDELLDDPLLDAGIAADRLDLDEAGRVIRDALDSAAS
ncbi:MAG: DEAD/DEAH box helicase [Phycisphaeraceae bacterium]|nr:DEAD/DEAH box helicase [Phycisphaeraceae bacterium]